MYGIETKVPWSVKFIKVDEINRHPSQIYEALTEGILLFIILNYLFRKFKNVTGLISGYFLILYSLFRFIIEFFREPDLQIGYLFLNLSMGQIISLIAFICGSLIVFYKNDQQKQY